MEDIFNPICEKCGEKKQRLGDPGPGGDDKPRYVSHKCKPTITRAEIEGCRYFDVHSQINWRKTRDNLITLIRSKGIEVVE